MVDPLIEIGDIKGLAALHRRYGIFERIERFIEQPVLAGLRIIPNLWHRLAEPFRPDEGRDLRELINAMKNPMEYRLGIATIKALAQSGDPRAAAALAAELFSPLNHLADRSLRHRTIVQELARETLEKRARESSPPR